MLGCPHHWLGEATQFAGRPAGLLSLYAFVCLFVDRIIIQCPQVSHCRAWGRRLERHGAPRVQSAAASLARSVPFLADNRRADQSGAAIWLPVRQIGSRPRSLGLQIPFVSPLARDVCPRPPACGSKRWHLQSADEIIALQQQPHADHDDGCDIEHHDCCCGNRIWMDGCGLISLGSSLGRPRHELVAADATRDAACDVGSCTTGLGGRDLPRRR